MKNVGIVNCTKMLLKEIVHDLKFRWMKKETVLDLSLVKERKQNNLWLKKEVNNEF